eukprot:TRINITY_DN957_c0_g1_i1.p1 TRINITY_DN957_c0_g1~~TRINITY_DN957_c0_g1_i1.p1  ORF type:complete len:622 (-),score=225.65 TRINITY_DN957_c0_g1_i1:471-2336(-)
MGMAQALMPLVNTPMMDYTIEFLASAGITHIWVFCCSHAAMIDEHVNKTYRHLPKVKVECIKADMCRSAGDALRVVYDRECFSSDFVLVSGDVVSNLDLKPILQQHQERRAKDKSIIMTQLLMQASPNHRSRAQEDATIVAIDRATSQLLHYDNSPETGRVRLSAELFAGRSAVEVRFDLLDCRVDICSLEVLNGLNDDFDYADLRTDWLMGMLNNELVEFKIQTHIITEGYANRCRNLSTYVALSNDIIHRWTYPMVPDNNWLNASSYEHTRPLVYKERGIKLAPTCSVRKNSVVGSGVEVGQHSAIISSVVGRRCIIGHNATIVNSYLWEGVRVESHSTITNAIVCSGAVIRENTHVGRGCVVSFGVVVGPDHSLPPHTKLTLHASGDSIEDESYTEEVDTGESGNGLRFVSPDNNPLHMLCPPRTVKADEEDELSDDSDTELEVLTGLQKFEDNVADVMQHGLAAASPDVESIAMEIVSARMAHDRTLGECPAAIMPHLFSHIKEGVTTKPALKKRLLATFKKWGALFSNFLDGTDDQVELIYQIQMYCEGEEQRESGISSVFQEVLNLLYQLDVIEEEAVLKWAEEHASLPRHERTFVDQCKDFIAWLESEDDDEDD